MRQWQQITRLLSVFSGSPAHGRRRTALVIHHVTWGSLNSGVGLLAGLACLAAFPAKVFRYEETAVVLLPSRQTTAATLGPIILATGNPPPEMLAHERGHFLQSLALGPLYYLLIGIPSLLHFLWFYRFRRDAPHRDYFRFYTEAWADRWAGIKR